MSKILLISLMFINSTVFAQQFRGGILFGLNASQVDGDTWAGYTKFGFAIGAYVYRPISKIADVQLEIKYMGKGANNGSSANTIQYTNQLNYIEIPVILRLKTNTKIDLEGGLGYGYLFNNTIKDSYGSEVRTDLFKTSDFLFLAGIKYNASNKLAVTMRFSYSLLNIREGLPNTAGFRNGGAFNNILSIGLCYAINSNQKP